MQFIFHYIHVADRVQGMPMGPSQIVVLLQKLKGIGLLLAFRMPVRERLNQHVHVVSALLMQYGTVWGKRSDQTKQKLYKMPAV